MVCKAPVCGFIIAESGNGETAVSFPAEVGEADMLYRYTSFMIQLLLGAELILHHVGRNCGN